MSDWLDDELETLDLGDPRRVRRIRSMVARMAEHPGGSVPQTFRTYAEAAAAYRALSSEAVTPEALREACVERVAGEERILAIQDTTAFKFNHHPGTADLGPIGPPESYGYWLHSVLAVSEQGVPLGLLHQATWARDPEAEGTRERWREREFETKESFRWVAAPREAESFDLGRIVAQDRAGIPLASIRPLVFRASFQDEAPPFGDKLGLTKVVNATLHEASARDASGMVFVDAPAELPDAYSLAGRYKAEGEMVTVTVYVLRGQEQAGTFTAAGRSAALDDLASDILRQTEQLLGGAATQGEQQ